MTKKKLIFLIICILLVLSILFYSIERTLLTGDIPNILKIEIISYDAGKSSTTSFDKQEDIEEITANLQQTRILWVERFPDHTESIQNDSPYYIKVIYRNGKTDEIMFSENKSIIFRFLDTKGSSGDRGYVKGENDTLYEFICGFMKTRAV